MLRARLALAASAIAIAASTILSEAPRAADAGDRFEALAADFVKMKACQMAWNYHVDEAIAGGTDISPIEMQDPVGTRETSDGLPGTRYSYRTSSLTSSPVCGSYFIPDMSDASGSPALSAAQADAVRSASSAFSNAALTMNDILARGTAGDTTGNLSVTPSGAASAIHDSAQLYKTALEDQLKPMGLQLSDPLVLASLPVIIAPETFVPADERKTGLTAKFSGENTDTAWTIRLQVAKDLAAFYRSAAPSSVHK